MGSRANRNEKESARLGKPVYTRVSTVGDDLKDIARGIGNSVGGVLGNARDTLKNRGNQIDKAVDDAQE